MPQLALSPVRPLILTLTSVANAEPKRISRGWAPVGSGRRVSAQKNKRNKQKKKEEIKKREEITKKYRGERNRKKKRTKKKKN